MGAVRDWTAQSRLLFLRAARRVHGRQPLARRTLFRYSQRPAVRVARRGRELEFDRRLAARGAVCESRRGRLIIAMLIHLPSALRRFARDHEVVELRLRAEMRMTIGEAIVMH